MSLEDLEPFLKSPVMRRLYLEQAECWLKIIPQIPSLNFPPEYQVQIIPPFGGAMARFRVRTAEMPPKEFVSVYLDFYNSLGYMEGPYWESYGGSGDPERFMLDDTNGLLSEIANQVKEMESKIITISGTDLLGGAST